MSRQAQHYTAVFDAKAATGVSKVIFCRDFRNANFQITAALNSSLTFKFVGALGDTAPDFSSAQSTTNVYDYLAFADLQNPGTLVAGDTGVTLNDDTAANNCHIYEVNTNGIDWVAIVITSYTDGSLSAVATLTDNA